MCACAFFIIVLIHLLHDSCASHLVQTFSRDLLRGPEICSDLFRPFAIVEAAPRWLL